MRPGWIASPSSGWTAGNGETRLRIVGSTLGLWAGTCRTTKTDAGRSAGKARTSCVSASTPPAEAPTTIMSWPGMLGLPCLRLLASLHGCLWIVHYRGAFDYDALLRPVV